MLLLMFMLSLRDIYIYTQISLLMIKTVRKPLSRLYLDRNSEIHFFGLFQSQWDHGDVDGLAVKTNTVHVRAQYMSIFRGVRNLLHSTVC